MLMTDVCDDDTTFSSLELIFINMSFFTAPETTSCYTTDVSSAHSWCLDGSSAVSSTG